MHIVPIAVLVTFLGMPSGLDATFWRIAIPAALIEAVLQAVYAPSIGTSVFSAVHLMVFGVAQVWMFWRFGFMWMLGFRLVYYALWHLAWGRRPTRAVVLSDMEFVDGVASRSPAPRRPLGLRRQLPARPCAASSACPWRTG